jgi:PBP1b-binding outer membrane lipoprotein LpoB
VSTDRIEGGFFMRKISMFAATLIVGLFVVGCGSDTGAAKSSTTKATTSTTTGDKMSGDKMSGDKMKDKM